MRVLFAILTALGFTAAAFADDLPTPAGRVILTVAGDLPAGNAPSANPDDVNFAGYLDLEYDKAMAFDDLMLADLPQHKIAATLLDSGKEITYSGPRLSQVLAVAGADGKVVLPMALDGYQAEIDWTLIKAYEPILATHADGKPMSIGGLGPAMVVFPVVENTELYESFDALQVFATFFIAVE